MHSPQEPYNGIHPLLARRFSPYRFDPSAVVDDHALGLLLEAARWAPSAGNSQPWGFFIGRPGEPEHDRVLPCLAPSSAPWATDAGLLVVTLTRRYVDDTQLIYSEFADYDLGQAIAHMTVQARAMGLDAHQFRAFDLERLTKELDPNPGWVIVSMVAVGRAADRPSEVRDRRSVADLCSAPWSPAE
ncbi:MULTISPECIES: nitroreductase family protein [unclassified Streptomyces]|uniref:nitroreductase family protein n=1 Tax=unclassified Streptomyces TaxID=2593676 RepID=UPI000DB97A56|nr:nitroreductase family protein [Streptomyces sp. PsTaAH-137]MYT69638.1 nitroreductase [Streptomyces sp. SID8367]